MDSGVPNRSKRSAFQGRLWKGNPSGGGTRFSTVARTGWRQRAPLVRTGSRAVRREIAE